MRSSKILAPIGVFVFYTCYTAPEIARVFINSCFEVFFLTNLQEPKNIVSKKTPIGVFLFFNTCYTAPKIAGIFINSCFEVFFTNLQQPKNTVSKKHP